MIQGDHVTFLNVYKAFLQSGKSSQWCYKNHVNYHAMVCMCSAISNSRCFVWCMYPVFLLNIHFNFQHVVQRKVLEVREQLKRIAQRIGIVLKSCDGDMQVDFMILLLIYLASFLNQRTALPEINIYFFFISLLLQTLMLKISIKLFRSGVPSWNQERQWN